MSTRPQVPFVPFSSAIWGWASAALGLAVLVLVLALGIIEGDWFDAHGLADSMRTLLPELLLGVVGIVLVVGGSLTALLRQRGAR